MSNITVWEYVQQLEEHITMLEVAVANLTHHYDVSLKKEREYCELLTRQLEHLLSKTCWECGNFDPEHTCFVEVDAVRERRFPASFAQRGRKGR